MYPTEIDTALLNNEMTRPQKLLNDAFLSIPGDTFHEKLRCCALCNCCPRHKLAKPVVLEPWVETTVKYVSLDPSWKDCDCDCRHLARFICRQVDHEDVTPERIRGLNENAVTPPKYRNENVNNKKNA